MFYLFRSAKKVAKVEPSPLDATVELAFPKRNMSFNQAVDSINELTPSARLHFFRRLVIGISKEDRDALDDILADQLMIDYNETIREQKEILE